jgi:sulfatase maturation enzyme AslB (radical SAM superfamily)
MGLDFFKRSVELVEQYRRPGQVVPHTVQTNGILWSRPEVKRTFGYRSTSPFCRMGR